MSFCGALVPIEETQERRAETRSKVRLRFADFAEGGAGIEQRSVWIGVAEMLTA